MQTTKNSAVRHGDGVSVIAESGGTKSATFVPRRFKEDLKALEKNYCLSDGLEINLTLQEALQLLPRDYPKTEAYIGLIHWLKRTYGVVLNITSRYYSRKEDNKNV